MVYTDSFIIEHSCGCFESVNLVVSDSAFKNINLLIKLKIINYQL